MTAATAMDQKKKRKRKRSSVFLPHDLIVEELLTRLPAKSLMRFKCVSKLWCSTILDPAFCNVYFESRVMVLIDLLAEGASGFGYLRRATLCRRRRVLELLDDDVFYMPDFERATEVINGLVCLYTADDHRVSICNVTTREIMDLPLSHLNQNIHSPQTSYQYYLGLGATWNSECSTWNSEYHYKLLRACTFVAPFVDGEDIHHITECEILTVGKDSSWRVLQGPTRALDLWNQNSVYFNGLLFWWNRTHQVIIAFYFGAEDFVEISSPSRGQICEGPLYQCRGCLVLVVGLVDRKLELWAFEEEKEKSNYGGGETVSPLRKWIKHVIDIPYAFSAERGCQLIGNLPIGAIFMTFGILEQEEEKEINNSSMSPVMAIPPIVSYDLTTGKVENFIFANEFSTSRDSLLNDPGRFRLSYYIENISPLSVIISSK